MLHLSLFSAINRAIQKIHLDAFFFIQHNSKASLGVRISLLAFLFLQVYSFHFTVNAAPTASKKNTYFKVADLQNDLTNLLYSSENTIQLATDSLLVDSVVTGFVPALSYSTEVGLAGGLIWSRLAYGQQYPFNQHISIASLASSKGLAGLNFFLDQPCSFICSDRFILNVILNRFLEDQYYGVYTATRLNLDNNPKRFEYRSFTMKLNLEYRMSVKKLPLASEYLSKSLYGFLSADLQYKTPWNNESGKLIMVEQPTGYQGAYGFWLGFGGLIDTRNSEFYPSQGWYSKQQFKGSVESVLSDFNQSSFLSDTRFYHDFKLIIPIVFAQRVSYQWSNSEEQTPYWSFPSLGGEEYLRGYVNNRFLVPQFWATNTELRTWLFDVNQYNLKIGGTLFLDAGSFTDDQTWLSDDWADNLKYTAGFGGLVSFFSPDFILRVDLGVSEEGYGIFFSTGVLF